MPEGKFAIVCTEDETTPEGNWDDIDPDKIPVPPKTWTEPETVPEGKLAIVCADEDTVPEGTDVDPDKIPVPLKLDMVCAEPETTPEGN